MKNTLTLINEKDFLKLSFLTDSLNSLLKTKYYYLTTSLKINYYFFEIITMIVYSKYTSEKIFNINDDFMDAFNPASNSVLLTFDINNNIEVNNELDSILLIELLNILDVQIFNSENNNWIDFKFLKSRLINYYSSLKKEDDIFTITKLQNEILIEYERINNLSENEIFLKVK